MDIHYVAPPTGPGAPGKRWTSTTSPLKEMDIHYVALPPPTGPEAPSQRWTSTTSPRNPDRKPAVRGLRALRRLLTPRPPPPFDFGQSNRVRERDFEIAPKFSVLGPLLRSWSACSTRCQQHSGAEREHLGDAGTRRRKGGGVRLGNFGGLASSPGKMVERFVNSVVSDPFPGSMYVCMCVCD